jgi:hypothetical protein
MRVAIRWIVFADVFSPIAEFASIGLAITFVIASITRLADSSPRTAGNRQ